MRKLAVLLLLAILMAVTNPTPDDFRSHVRAEVVAAARQSGRSGVLEAAQALKDITWIDVVTWYADKLAEGAQHRNYVLFSLYTATVERQRHTWIGLFQRFVRLS